MSELLSTEQYKDIAAGLTLPTKAFINGVYVDAIDGATMASINPATGEEITQIAACKAADVDLAVANAKAKGIKIAKKLDVAGQPIADNKANP